MSQNKKTKKIKGRAEIVKQGDTPGGDCQAKDCPLQNKEIIGGMGIVYAEGKTYHFGCAKRNNIDFKIPAPKTIVRGKNG